MDRYKYLYLDPNLMSNMPAIFNESGYNYVGSSSSNRRGGRTNSNSKCGMVSYNNVSRNRIPDYVTKDQVEIREILDARYSSYQGFFRPVRFSFGEDALENSSRVDSLNTDTNQRFLDRI